MKSIRRNPFVQIRAVPTSSRSAARPQLRIVAIPSSRSGQFRLSPLQGLDSTPVMGSIFATSRLALRLRCTSLPFRLPETSLTDCQGTSSGSVRNPPPIPPPPPSKTGTPFAVTLLNTRRLEPGGTAGTRAIVLSIGPWVPLSHARPPEPPARGRGSWAAPYSSNAVVDADLVRRTGKKSAAGFIFFGGAVHLQATPFG